MLRLLRSRVSLMVVAGLGLALVAAEPASAGVTVRTTGASLTCNVYSTGRFTGYADCWLRDTRADNRQVYALTQQEAFPIKRRTNSGGNGTTRYFRENINGDTDHWFWSYKVCRKVNLGRDNCSAWHRVQA